MSGPSTTTATATGKEKEKEFSGGGHLSAAALAVVAFAAAKLMHRRLTTLRAKTAERCMPKVEDIILGGSTFAGMYEPISEEEVFVVLKEALDVGITQIDTAPHYGLGVSEERIGAFLRRNRQLPNPLTKKAEENLKVWTKVGRLIRKREDVDKTIDAKDVQWDNVSDHPKCIFKGIPNDRVPVLDYSSGGAQASFTDSEKRLGEGYIAGLRVHDCESDALLEATISPGNGALAGLHSLKASGKVESIGLGVNDPSYALKALSAPKGVGQMIDTVMIAGKWNLLDQSAFELLCVCQKRGIRVHNAGVFASGLLVGGSTYAYAPAPRAMIDKARRWRVLCQKYDLKIQSVALAFAFMPTCVTRVAIGVKTCEELNENLSSIKYKVPRELWLDAKKEGLLLPFIQLPK